MEEVMEALSRSVATLPGLRLLVFHGSRARGDAHARSDFDFAYLAAPGFDEFELRARLDRILKTEAIDVADLGRAGALLRYRVARDGVVVFQSSPGVFEDFQLEAALFWIDVRDIVRAEHAAALEALD